MLVWISLLKGRVFLCLEYSMVGFVSRRSLAYVQRVFFIYAAKCPVSEGVYVESAGKM